MHFFLDPRTGDERKFGNLTPQQNASDSDWTVYGDTPDTPLIAQAKWDDLIKGFDPMSPLHPKLPYVHDQNGIGQCNADAQTAAAEYIGLQMGLDFVQLSAADLYDRINGGADNGSLLERGMAEMLARGVGTAATCGTLWRRGMKNASAEERRQYMTTEAYLCPTFAHCMSAVLSGFALVSGIMWYDNFDTDAEGWLPLSGRGRPGGHAVFGYKPTARMIGGRTVYGIWHQNSWTTRFGMGGRCVFASSLYSGPVGGWWALRQMTDRGGDMPKPKFPDVAKWDDGKLPVPPL